MKRSVILFALLISWSASGFSQKTDWWTSYSPPHPSIGWDSLAKRMTYPDLCVRAGLEGLYHISVSIDSIGNISKIDQGDLPDIFRDSVTQAIRSTQWELATYKNVSQAATVKIPIFFYLYVGNNSKPLIIDSFKPLVERTY